MRPLIIVVIVEIKYFEVEKFINTYNKTSKTNLSTYDLVVKQLFEISYFL